MRYRCLLFVLILLSSLYAAKTVIATSEQQLLTLGFYISGEKLGNLTIWQQDYRPTEIRKGEELIAEFDWDSNSVFENESFLVIFQIDNRTQKTINFSRYSLYQTVSTGVVVFNETGYWDWFILPANQSAWYGERIGRVLVLEDDCPDKNINLKFTIGADEKSGILDFEGEGCFIVEKKALANKNEEVYTILPIEFLEKPEMPTFDPNINPHVRISLPGFSYSSPFISTSRTTLDKLGELGGTIPQEFGDEVEKGGNIVYAKLSFQVPIRGNEGQIISSQSERYPLDETIALLESFAKLEPKNKNLFLS